MLKRATHRTDETTHWGVRLWRVDVLKLPPAAEAAQMEAAEPHLIMLAVGHLQSLLPWLMDWLERCVIELHEVNCDQGVLNAMQPVKVEFLAARTIVNNVIAVAVSSTTEQKYK
jgi:hypothetical protein